MTQNTIQNLVNINLAMPSRLLQNMTEYLPQFQKVEEFELAIRFSDGDITVDFSLQDGDILDIWSEDGMVTFDSEEEGGIICWVDEEHETIWNFRIYDNASRHSGMSEGCFFTDWVDTFGDPICEMDEDEEIISLNGVEYPRSEIIWVLTRTGYLPKSGYIVDIHGGLHKVDPELGSCDPHYPHEFIIDDYFLVKEEELKTKLNLVTIPTKIVGIDETYKLTISRTFAEGLLEFAKRRVKREEISIYTSNYSNQDDYEVNYNDGVFTLYEDITNTDKRFGFTLQVSYTTIRDLLYKDTEEWISPSSTYNLDDDFGYFNFYTEEDPSRAEDVSVYFSPNATYEECYNQALFIRGQMSEKDPYWVPELYDNNDTPEETQRWCIVWSAPQSETIPGYIEIVPENYGAELLKKHYYDKYDMCFYGDDGFKELWKPEDSLMMAYFNEYSRLIKKGLSPACFLEFDLHMDKDGNFVWNDGVEHIEPPYDFSEIEIEESDEGRKKVKKTNPIKKALIGVGLATMLLGSTVSAKDQIQLSGRYYPATESEGSYVELYDEWDGESYYWSPVDSIHLYPEKYDQLCQFFWSKEEWQNPENFCTHDADGNLVGMPVYVFLDDQNTEDKKDDIIQLCGFDRNTWLWDVACEAAYQTNEELGGGYEITRDGNNIHISLKGGDE